MMQVIENNINLSKNAIFNLIIQTMDNEIVGNLTVYIHPEDSKGGQVHIEIEKKWRCKWVSRSLRKTLMTKLCEIAKNYGLSILYSTALTKVSPRLLAFAGFIEYDISKPKTYYYLTI